MRFDGYYKYRFSYKGEDGYSVSAGGDSSNIYRASLEAEMPLWRLLYEASTEYASAYIGETYIDLDTTEAWQAVLEFWRASRNDE